MPEATDLHHQREGAIDQLSEAFSSDHLGVEEFERRLALAHRARDASELAAVVRDLPARTTQALVPAAPELPATATAAPVMRVVLGSVTRGGAWTPPRTMEARTTLGSVVLDYRDAVLAPGVNELHVKAFLGAIEIIVPPTLAVTVDGGAFLGSFDHIDRAPSMLAPDTAVLHIRGSALLGSVEVITRLPKGRNPKNLEPR
jgi:hypothetical protein